MKLASGTECIIVTANHLRNHVWKDFDSTHNWKDGGKFGDKGEAAGCLLETQLIPAVTAHNITSLK